MNVFITAPLETGASRYFLESTQERLNFGNLFYAFTSGKYGNIVFVNFLRSLFLFLWSLLLVIPGIVMGYAYSMVPYLLAENPALDYRRALSLSKDMTQGHKWEIFVLELSFIGWFLLGALACGLGTLFVNPYYHSTRAQLYVALRGVASTGDRYPLRTGRPDGIRRKPTANSRNNRFVWVSAQEQDTVRILVDRVTGVNFRPEGCLPQQIVAGHEKSCCGYQIIYKVSKRQAGGYGGIRYYEGLHFQRYYEYCCGYYIVRKRCVGNEQFRNRHPRCPLYHCGNPCYNSDQERKESQITSRLSG